MNREQMQENESYICQVHQIMEKESLIRQIKQVNRKGRSIGDDRTWRAHLAQYETIF